MPIKLGNLADAEDEDDAVTKRQLDLKANTSQLPDLSLYAPKESPVLTGVPASPTATPGTNTTQIATTAFVTAAVAAVSSGLTSYTAEAIVNRISNTICFTSYSTIYSH